MRASEREREEERGRGEEGAVSLCLPRDRQLAVGAAGLTDLESAKKPNQLKARA